MRTKLPVALFFLTTGTAHLTFARRFFEDIVPPWLPASPKVVNEAAGIAEITGGALALMPGAEDHARKYLTALLLAVYPANVHMALRPEDSRSGQAVPVWTLWARLPLQFAAIAWVRRALR